MTENKLIKFFLGKLDKLENLSKVKLSLAHRLPVFPESKTANRWRLIIILSGKRLHRFADGEKIITATLNAGDILLVEPYAGVWMEEDQSYDMLSIVSNPAAIRFVSKQRQKGISMPTAPDAVLHCGQNELRCFQLLLELLKQIVNRKKHSDINPLLKFMWSECYAAIHSMKPGTISSPQYLIAKITAFIDEHLTENLTCSYIANEFKITPNYVAQLFAREMVCGFSEYICRQRLELAQELLRNSKMNVGEIADYCGYNQANYFIRVYKKQYGHTPLTYRNRWV